MLALTAYEGYKMSRVLNCHHPSGKELKLTGRHWNPLELCGPSFPETQLSYLSNRELHSTTLKPVIPRALDVLKF